MGTNKRAGFIRVLALVFGLLLLGQQIFTYYYVKRLDRNYSGLITKKTTELRAINLISNESSNIQTSLLTIAIIEPGKYPLYAAKIKKSEHALDSLFGVMLNVCESDKDKKAVGELKKEYESYKGKYTPLLSSLLAENFAGTRQQQGIEDLRNSFDNYLDQQEKQAEFFKKRAEILSDKFSHQNHKTSTLVLLVGSLPYLILGCALIISFIVIVVLGNVMNWFRHQE
jgi:hypothetical protein